MFASMDDAGSTFKPVLHVGLVPVDDKDISSRIRQSLGMPVVKKDDVKVIKEPFQLLVQSSGTDKSSSLAPLSLILACFCHNFRFVRNIYE